MNKARNKVLKDIEDQKNESKRMYRNKKFIWKLRGLVINIEYWIVSLALLSSLVVWFVTGDYWKALAFYVACLLYSVGANIRGLSLHLENAIEWQIKKTL